MPPLWSSSPTASPAAAHEVARPEFAVRSSRRLSRPTPTLVAIVAIVATYVVTRVIFMARFPYFLDEGTYAGFTNQASHSLRYLFVSESIGREPLQIWLGIPWVKLGFSALTAMRLVSFLSGLLTVGVVGLLGRQLGGTGVGLASAGLCVVLPFFVVHDGIGIMEPLVTLIVASLLYVQVELARRPSLRWGLVLGVLAAAGILTKENTLPGLALIPVSLLCFDWSPAGRRRRITVWLGAIAITGAMVIGAKLLLQSSSYYAQLQATRKTPYYTVRPLHAVLAHPFAGWATAWHVFRPAFLGYVTIPLILLAVVGGALAFGRRPRLTLVLLAWFVVPFLVSMSFTALPFPRHVMYLMPPAIVLMGYALVEGARWATRTWPTRVGWPVTAVAVVLLLIPALRFDGQVLSNPTTAHYPGLDEVQYVTGSGNVWPKVAAVIRRGAVGSRVVILNPAASVAILQILLGSGRYVFVGANSPLASRAQFGLYDNLDPFADLHGVFLMRQLLRPIGQFARPRGGGVVTVYGRRQ